MGGRPRNSTPTRGNGGAKTSESREQTRGRVARLAQLLAEAWPDAHVELDHQDAYQLLVATILSAQSTDKMINTITPALFAKYPDAGALAGADVLAVEQLIVKSGFFRMKAKHITGMARAVVAQHGGEIPRTMESLVALPGVARKTANVVLGSAMGIASGVVVDTHVARLSGRLGLTTETDPVKIEQDLMDLVPKAQWVDFAHRLIWHGRRVCFARKPDCEHCTLAPLCPSAFRVEPGTGVTTKRGKEAAKAKPKPTARKGARR